MNSIFSIIAVLLIIGLFVWNIWRRFRPENGMSGRLVGKAFLTLLEIPLVLLLLGGVSIFSGDLCESSYSCNIGGFGVMALFLLGVPSLLVYAVTSSFVSADASSQPRTTKKSFLGGMSRGKILSIVIPTCLIILIIWIVFARS